MSTKIFKNNYYLIMVMSRAISDATIIKILRKNGKRVTPQRITISRSALLHRDHPSAETVYQEVKKVYPTISLSTVYNTLHILKEINMIQELTFTDDLIRFDPNIQPHLNLICLRCGRISDFEDRNLKEIITRTVQKARFHETGQRFDIYGVCNKCRVKFQIKQ